MPDRIFTLKEWKRIKRDIFIPYFEQEDLNNDLRELMKSGMLEEEPEVELNGNAPNSNI